MWTEVGVFGFHGAGCCFVRDGLGGFVVGLGIVVYVLGFVGLGLVFVGCLFDFTAGYFNLVCFFCV